MAVCVQSGQHQNADKPKEERSYTQIEPIPDPVTDPHASEVTDELLELFGGTQY